MAIIIPTAELTGLLTDVAGLMPDNKKASDRVIRIEWDGEELHAHACDGLAAGVSSWNPDDAPSSMVAAYIEKEGIIYGPSDESEIQRKWSVYLNGDEALEIVKAFKLADKFAGVPLAISVSPTGNRLSVERSRDTGKTAHLMSVTPVADVKLPDIRSRIGDLWEERSVGGSIRSWAHHLGAFLNAGRRGPIEQIETGNGGTGPVVVLVGERFIGYYTPDVPKSNSDLLRTGSGLHVSRSSANLPPEATSYDPALDGSPFGDDTSDASEATRY